MDHISVRSKEIPSTPPWYSTRFEVPSLRFILNDIGEYSPLDLVLRPESALEVLTRTQTGQAAAHHDADTTA
jgi:hypothetical protein